MDRKDFSIIILIVVLFVLVSGLRARVAKLEGLQKALPEKVVEKAEVEVPKKPAIKIVKYIDGDTFYVEHIPSDPIFDKIRMLCIDTPERGRRYYMEASAALKGILSKAKVIKFVYEGNRMRGNYNRLLCYVYADGVNVNVEMVRLGWSAYYKKYGKSLNYHEDFVRAEKEAKENRRGIWK